MIKYIKNGSDISKEHSSQIAFSNDNVNWQFFSKKKVKELSGKDAFVKLLFDDQTSVVFDITKVLNQPEWYSTIITGGGTGYDINTGLPYDIPGTVEQVLSLETAIKDISEWLYEDSDVRTANLINEQLHYQFGTKGWDVIMPHHGLINGNWYLVLPADDSIFTNLTEKNVNLANTKMSGMIAPEGLPLTSEDMKGNGFTSIQLSSGKVWAYKL